MTQANTALEPKRHAKTRSGQAARAARPNGGAAAAARVDPASFRDAILAKLTYSVGKDPAAARDHDWFAATALAVRDRIVDRWMDSTRATYQREQKRVYYLSLEFLIGRLLRDALGNLGLLDTAREALRRARRRPRPRRARLEPDAALGNGGLGRLAACFMDSMATLGIAGLRLRHPLRSRPVPPGASTTAGRSSCRRTGSPHGNPWEFERPRGRLPDRLRRHGRARRRDGADRAPRLAARRRRVLAVAYDTPVVGWRGRHVNTLRLWSARAVDPIGSRPSTAATMSARSPTEHAPRAISRVLYPNDATPAGQELRLRQEYFFTSASLQDIVRRHLQQHGDLRIAAGQGGDPAQRHPSGDRRRRADAAPGRRARHRLGGGLGDHHAAPSATPTTRCCPRRWRRWPVPLLERLLPRHMQIIYLINCAAPATSCARARRTATPAPVAPSR